MIELQKYNKLESEAPSFRLSKNLPQRRYDSVTMIVVACLATIFIASLSVCYRKVDVEAFALSAYEDDMSSQAMTEYLNFIAKYGKAYASKVETANKYRNFKNNYMRVMEHNKNAHVVPFLLEIN